MKSLENHLFNKCISIGYKVLLNELESSLTFNNDQIKYLNSRIQSYKQHVDDAKEIENTKKLIITSITTFEI